ncbi:hypothetical protein DU002_13675 [Corallincola holothuriorum]|uniref:Uncharacterized protein n=1 Tax=Corallincola holothuriorum TaxID=2282215 RepID=A0A368NDV6_9GAMM|nr:hypothetical protein DU002_13675 [Corallincola holothuriorum]
MIFSKFDAILTSEDAHLHLRQAAFIWHFLITVQLSAHTPQIGAENSFKLFRVCANRKKNEIGG